jgi:uncharacterized membrane protein
MNEEIADLIKLNDNNICSLAEKGLILFLLTIVLTLSLRAVLTFLLLDLVVILFFNNCGSIILYVVFK